jgi:hypothetical protein
MASTSSKMLPRTDWSRDRAMHWPGQSSPMIRTAVSALKSMGVHGVVKGYHIKEMFTEHERAPVIMRLSERGTHARRLP